jgi:transcriptional regulator GlxA family with amidase domain
MDAQSVSITSRTEIGATVAAPLSLQRLQSAIAEISRSLGEALRDDRTNAALYLRRAQDLLETSVGTPRATEPGPRLIAWQIRRVREHIDASLASPLRNRDLAALVRLSEFHFNVAFRNSLGESPHRYVIRRRIARAQELMLSTTLPLCDIAGECGLADQAHLSRLFRQVVGETPASWRRDHQAAPQR